MDETSGTPHGRRGATAPELERLLRAESVSASASPGNTRPLVDSGLTPRETEVAGLIAQGLTDLQIANRLGISRWTAVNHVRAILRKTRCRSRVQVATAVVTAHEGRPAATKADSHPGPQASLRPTATTPAANTTRQRTVK